MSKRLQTVVAIAVATFFLTTLSTLVVADDQSKVEGMIISRSGETLVVRGAEGKTNVVLTESTETVDYRGLFGLSKEQMGSTVLIPGVKVKAFGTGGQGGQLVASKIVVDGDDLEAAEMIQSGLHPTAEQVAANVQAIETNRQNIAGHSSQLASQKEMIENNRQDITTQKEQIAQNMKDIQENTDRFMQLSEYDVKAQATAHFGIGSSKLSQQDQQELQQLAQTATGINGYLVEVIGYADATGGAEMNTRLSESRAKAVINYLVQQGNVPVRHIVAPGAMGEYGSAATNETKQGRAENRRVEVKVLVNKGIAGS